MSRAPEAPPGEPPLGVDEFLHLDERAYWMAGWTRDRVREGARLSVFSPEGEEVELPEPYWVRTPEGRDRFIGAFEVSAPSTVEGGWIVRLRDPSGDAIELHAPSPVSDLQEARLALLDYFGRPRGGDEELLERHVHPALARLQERHRRSVAIAGVVDYGKPSDSASVSVVVTLYGRVDFLRHQMLQFARDRFVRDHAELIYVLDSPELGDSLDEVAFHAYALHRVPFRVARLTRNAGFPLANNLGASLARGRTLLLLNSDVLPDRPGWLNAMSSFYAATPGIGALGSKLVYEDESIQHAGMYFEREAPSREWENLHYFKGLHRSFPAANETRSVPAITGALLMVDRALYEEVGGLSASYVQIGYEDSDLCLRLISGARTNWYLADAELYHLEGQAHPTRARVASNRYNRWLQAQRWDSLIEEVMGGQRPAGAALELSG